MVSEPKAMICVNL